MNVKDLSNLKKIWAFTGDYAIFATTDNLNGIINRKGEIVLPADKYNSIGNTEITDLFVLDTYNDDFSSFSRRFYNARTNEFLNHDVCYIDGDFLTQCIDGKLGICNSNYETIVPAIYSAIWVWEDCFWAQKDDKWGALNFDGSVRLPFVYDDCIFSLGTKRNEHTRSVVQDGEHFLINSTGARLTRDQYDYLEPFNGAGLAIMQKDGCFGVIDQQEHIVYQSSLRGTNGRSSDHWTFYWCAPHCIAYREDGLLGVIKINDANNQASILAQPTFSMVYPLSNSLLPEKIRVVDEHNHCGLLDASTGKSILPCSYKSILCRKRTDVYVVETIDGKWGVLDLQGQVIVPTIYDWLNIRSTYGLNEIAVKKDGRCYFINSAQQEIHLF